MTNKELIKLLEGDETEVVVAEERETGGYTIFPLIKKVVPTELSIIRKCKVRVIIFES